MSEPTWYERMSIVRCGAALLATDKKDVKRAEIHKRISEEMDIIGRFLFSIDEANIIHTNHQRNVEG